MDEYSVDEIKEQKDEEGLAYKIVGTYKIDMNLKSGKNITPCSINTIVFTKSRKIGWVKKRYSEPVLTQKDVKLNSVNSIKKDYICRIIQQVYSVMTKEKIGSELILKNHKSLVERMLADYVAYYKKEFKK